MNAATPDRIPPAEITGLVLAGGQGTRMGGVDKGLQPFQGRPLAAHAIERLAPQVGALLISANRHHDAYRAYGATVVADQDGSYAGPLAGIEAGLRAARTAWLACVPCDAPCFPAELVERLAAALALAPAHVAVARTVAGRHPVFMMVSTSVAPHLAEFLASGERRVRQWQDQMGSIEVDFDPGAHAFDNINTLDALHTLERKLMTAP